MKVVVAPDSFKGSLSSQEVSEAIKKGILLYDNNTSVTTVPMADGGEGTVEAIINNNNGEIIKLEVNDPLMRPVEGFYGKFDDTAIIEMAAASGLPLLTEEEKNPLIASSYGTGQLIKDALDKGAKSIIMAIGGSATNDGGLGLLKALGVKFLDQNRKEIGEGGGSLSKLASIDASGLDSRIKDTSISVACDVDNPLCGLNGASHVFGPQKGATPEMILELDKNLENLAKVSTSAMSVDNQDIPGAGAAGGLGFALITFLNAELKKGIEIVIEETNLKDALKGADLVITGEGQIDFQTAFGKTPFGVAQAASEQNIPVIALCGQLGDRYEELFNKGFVSIYSISNKPMTLLESMNNTEQLLINQTENIMRTFAYNNVPYKEEVYQYEGV